jgi:hypothetical protein
MGPFTGTDMIMVGSESNPVPVVPDPTTTAPWMKQFILNRDGKGWATDGPLSMATVMETITFPPSTSGTTVRPIDWHEDIDPTVGDGGSFKWAGGTIEVPMGSPPIPGMVSGDGKSIWFNFPPVPPGLPIKINKQLMWAGRTPITPGPSGTNNYLIKVNERPSIPEPATALVIGVAAAAGLGVRRRRQ